MTIIEEKDRCEYCRGTGRIYKGSQFLEGDPCTSCNGTGIRGEPWKGCLFILAFLIVIAYVAWRVLAGIYD